VTVWRLRAASSLLTLPALFLLSALGGCAETFDATTLGVPVTLASPAGQQPAGARFQVTSHALYGFWGLAKIKDPSLRKALAAQLAGGSGVADLRIKVRSQFPDVLVTVLTAGLIVPRSVTYDGIVLK
jgi:hypothetical protein